MLALVHILVPALRVDGITLVLIVIAILPWLNPIFRSLEFPGGWKIEFRELEKAAQRAEQLGLLSPRAPIRTEPDFLFERVAEQDPSLALVGLRIEIEKRLLTLAEKNNIDVRGRGLGQLLRVLSERDVIGQQERSVLADLTGLLNSAAHGASVDRRAADWAMDVGPRLLRALDELTKGSP